MATYGGGKAGAASYSSSGTVRRGSGGGGLGWKNNIPVTPAQVISIKVGIGGAVRVIWGANRAFPSTNTGNV
jgi:hypothetical protein